MAPHQYDIKQSKPLKIKNKIPSNLFNEKYELKLGELCIVRTRRTHSWIGKIGSFP